MLGEEIVSRINQLGAISETPEHLARIFLSPEHQIAGDLILSWMKDAGMAAHLDAIGNVCGRYEGDRPGLPCLMLGSHYDTVRDAGKWDGPLGVITAISCVAELNRRGVRLPFAIEVVGFADEEGVRFASTLLGSRAVAGTFDESVLGARDRDGLTMREAMAKFGLDPGHAGTVPMAMRRDALAGAAECIVAVEQFCEADRDGLVGTVGAITALPGATNVIPGRVSLTLDIRAPTDEHRKLAVANIVRHIEAIAKRRDLSLQIDVTHENRTVPCASWLKDQVADAVAAEGFAVFDLPSGAGHDGMAMIDIADVAMLFVRCRGGISHNPAEHVELADADAGARVLLRLIENFRPREADGPGKA
jgi:allantoate deiminase